ncbi:chymotrypsinogen A-like [Daphnia carinata]|uniref:chymotrypsinogen A-like n=1 Tax=Daphnia carinata TaxID=120202 RepID=UPI00257970B7|nr:chymotrypsinogen A-like [Daphnia carinata]
MQPILFFLLAVVAVVTGVPHGEGRMSGGIPITIAPPGTEGYKAMFPYVVSIEYEDSHICGGFIYSEKWVVTTASCVENKVLSSLVVVAGQVNLIDYDYSEERHAVFRVFPYDTYDSVTRADDIALIELSSNISFADTYKNFIKFNEVYTDEKPTPLGTFMGWGATVDGGGFSPRLRYAELTMLETSGICGTYGADEFQISKMICAMDMTSPPTIAPCTFDEGSPIVQTYGTTGAETTIAVGVLSKRSPTCNPEEPSVFTRLSVYYAWLYRVAGQQPTSARR